MTYAKRLSALKTDVDFSCHPFRLSPRLLPCYWFSSKCVRPGFRRAASCNACMTSKCRWGYVVISQGQVQYWTSFRKVHIHNSVLSCSPFIFWLGNYYGVKRGPIHNWATLWVDPLSCGYAALPCLVLKSETFVRYLVQSEADLNSRMAFIEITENTDGSTARSWRVG